MKDQSVCFEYPVENIREILKAEREVTDELVYYGYNKEHIILDDECEQDKIRYFILAKCNDKKYIKIAEDIFSLYAVDFVVKKDKEIEEEIEEVEGKEDRLIKEYVKNNSIKDRITGALVKVYDRIRGENKDID